MGEGRTESLALDAGEVESLAACVGAEDEDIAAGSGLAISRV